MNFKNILMILLLFIAGLPGMMICVEEVELSEQSFKEKELEDKQKEWRELDERRQENSDREKKLRKELNDLKEIDWKIGSEMGILFNRIEDLEIELGRHGEFLKKVMKETEIDGEES